MKALAPVTVALSALALAGCGGGTGDVTAATPDAELLADLRKLATRAAKVSGEPAPTAEYFATNEQDAEAADSPGRGNGNPEAPVYVIVLHGQFECFECPHPPGTDNPHGHVMVLVVPASDAAGGNSNALAGSSFGLGDHEPDTSRLGEAHPLLG
jgi:hypothetical protein